MYQVDKRLQLGIEYNPLANEVGPLVNYMVAFEDKNWPMINIGTSSDRIGTPPGPQSYYVTFSKTFADAAVAPYVSLSYSESERGFTIPFGANIFLDKNWVLLPMYDGRKMHLLLTYRAEKFSVSLIWVWLKHPGIGLSWKL